MIEHLISWYRRDRDINLVTIGANCGLTGVREAGGGPLVSSAGGEKFTASSDTTTCIKCVGGRQ